MLSASTAKQLATVARGGPPPAGQGVSTLANAFARTLSPDCAILPTDCVAVEGVRVDRQGAVDQELVGGSARRACSHEGADLEVPRAGRAQQVVEEMPPVCVGHTHDIERAAVPRVASAEPRLAAGQRRPARGPLRTRRPREGAPTARPGVSRAATGASAATWAAATSRVSQTPRVPTPRQRRRRAPRSIGAARRAAVPPPPQSRCRETRAREAQRATNSSPSKDKSLISKATSRHGSAAGVVQ